MILGTCGLHVVHISIKTAKLQKLVKAVWQFTLDVPAIQAMHENISESTDYPDFVVTFVVTMKSVLKSQSC